MFESYPFTANDAVSDRFLKILEFLTKNGAPIPILTSIDSFTYNPDGNKKYTEYSLLFRAPGFDQLLLNAGMVLRGPSIALIELQIHFSFGNPTIPIFLDYIQEVTSKLSTPSELPPLPLNPVGVPIHPGAKIYFSNPGDTNPNGFIYISADGKKFQKVVKLTPFGPSHSYLELS